MILRSRLEQTGITVHIPCMPIQIRTSLAEPETGDTFVPHRPKRPDKVEGGRRFVLASEYQPSGDQPTAIAELTAAARDGERDQVLLGVTGSGKTFTMAKVIEELQRPALILAPNKILAAQLYGEFKSFFPENAVEYFVSYYDYYQPEAYVPRSDTYIEKESSVNESIDRMRHSATRALLERDDVIIVASVSCLYGIGSVETYSAMIFDLKKGPERRSARDRAQARRAAIQAQRHAAFQRGNFRVKGDTLEIFPSHYEDSAWRVSFFGDDIEEIVEFDPLTGKKVASLDYVRVFANSHYVTPGPTLKQAGEAIRHELAERLKELVTEGKLLEAQRLEQRTNFDLEMIAATGSCAGIENYSAASSPAASPASRPPPCSNISPKMRCCSSTKATSPSARSTACRAATIGERSRSPNTVSVCPRAIDNRPLRFNEWDAMRPQTTYVSATPGGWEMEQTGGVFAEQVIRPTGLIDPPVEIKPVEEQVQDCIVECRKTAEAGYRTLVTTLTKRMAEDLTEYMHEAGLKVRYMHSDVETLERIELIRDLRLGVYDVLVGINLLREGLDIPECGLVCIMDADKEGFLRSETSAHPDDRPRRAQRRRPRDPLRRSHDRQHGTRDQRNVAPPRKAARL